MSAPDAALSDRKRNWGRWGEDDERGTANLLTAERVLAATGLVRQGKVIPLALPIGETGTPTLPGRPPPQHFMRRDGGDYAGGLERASGFQSVDDVLMMPTHNGTHIDALAHVGDEHQLYNGFPLAGVRSNGARKLGIDKLASLVGRGVLLDLAPLAAQHVITPKDLEAAEQRQGLRVEAGTILLIRTGWLDVFRSQGPRAYFATSPGIGMAVARWLAERDVVAVGADNFAVEVIPTESGVTAPVHRYLIRDCGIYLMENLALDALAAAGSKEFLFVAAPLPIVGGVGSPINPLAIL